jgi:hypothetical protein
VFEVIEGLLVNLDKCVAVVLVVLLTTGAINLEQCINGMIALVVDAAMPFVATLAAVPYIGTFLVLAYVLFN